jgi:DNA-binding CsgD family transcriptional regulator
MSQHARGELDELWERAPELDAIAAGANDAAGGRGRVVIVEGPAGIGKTALLASGRDLAGRLGLEPLAARGAELERAFGFGVVRQLLEPAVQGNGNGDAGLAFVGAARHAASLFDVEVPDAAALPAGPEAAFAVLHSLYWLTGNLARRRPLALVVDDAHWADGASLRFLAYLVRRLEDLPVLLLVAARPPGEPGGLAVAPLLMDGNSGSTLRPAPLSDAAATRVVRSVMPDADHSLCHACRVATGGNPFFLRELAAALRDVGPFGAGDVLDAAPDGVVAAIRARLARFPVSARQLAAAASILGDGGLLRHAATIAGLDQPAAAEAADALRAGRIFDRDNRLTFLHPIIRSAVHEELATAARSSGHARAARLLASDDAPSERVAAHLLLTEPSDSEWACERLREAGREAIPRGAPDAAVTYLRRALLEPPPADTRPAVLLELGLAEALTLNLGPAIEHLRRGVETTRDTWARLYAARMLSSLVGIDSPADGVEILERALTASQNADPALAIHIEGHLVNMARFALTPRRRTAQRAARLRERVEAGELNGAMELTVAAAEAAMAGAPADRAVALAERAIEGLRAEPLLAITLGMAVRCLAVADRLTDAERVLTESIDDARRHHATYRMAPLLAVRSDARFRAGALRDAEADAREALTVYRGGGQMGALFAAALTMQALTEQGKLEAAESVLTASIGDMACDSIGDAYMSTLVLHARGRLRLAGGDAHRAVEDLLEVGARQEVMGEPNPAFLDWRSRAASALADLGRRGEALKLAEEELELAREFGAPRAIGIALRVSGVIEGGETGLARLREAVGVLADSPARLEQARALADLGVVLRRGRRIVEAREPLRLASDLARRCGANGLAELARTELRIAGGRPRRSNVSGVDALTTNELRVAMMAAEGRSNGEIAKALFVSRKTIEKHLSAAYRKLGITTRNDLAGALAAGATKK